MCECECISKSYAVDSTEDGEDMYMEMNKCTVSTIVDAENRPAPATKIYACQTCGRTFYTANALRKHAGVHKRTYSCNNCKKWFRDADSLLRHEDEHVTQLREYLALKHANRAQTCVIL